MWTLRRQPGWYLSGSSVSGRQYISYGGDGAKIEAQASPQIAFNSLFSGFMPAGQAERDKFAFQQRARKSVLDVVLDAWNAQRISNNEFTVVAHDPAGLRNVPELLSKLDQ